jgi:hypothetical protein
MTLHKAYFQDILLDVKMQAYDIMNAAPPVSAGGVVFLLLDDNITRKFPEGDNACFVEVKISCNKLLGVCTCRNRRWEASPLLYPW